MVDRHPATHKARISLQTLNAPTTTPAQIKEAERTLEDIKSKLDPTSCIQVAEDFLNPLLVASTPQHSISEIHFGFHLLDELILCSSTPWVSFHKDVRARVRQIAVTLFQQLSTTDATGHRLNRYPTLAIEKTIALLSAIAIREWPQRWPEFMDDLIADPRRAETSCHVLRVMSEELHDYPDSIENTRRQDLSKAMALTLQNTLQFVTAAANTFHQQRNYQALNAALQTLQSFLSWAALHEVFKIGVPSACFALLADIETRDGALAVLTTLARRQFAQAGNAHDQVQEADGKLTVENEFTFRDTVFGGIMQYVSTSTVPSIAAMSAFPPSGVFPVLSKAFAEAQVSAEVDSDEHEFHTAFFAMMCELGSVNFFPTYLYAKRTGVPKLSPSQKVCGAAFIELMLCALNSPSWSLRMVVLPFFAPCLGSISKQQANGTQMGELARFLVTGFLSAGALALVRFPNEYDELRKKLDEEASLDDDCLERDMFESVTARIINSLGVAAKLCPKEAIMPSLKRIASLLSSKPQKGSNVQRLNGGVLTNRMTKVRTPRSLGLIQPDDDEHSWKFGKSDEFSESAWIAAMNATIMAAEGAIPGVISSNVPFDRHSMLTLMMKCFEMNMSISSESLLPLKAHTYRVFWPLYQEDIKTLMLCFQTLVAQGSDMGLPAAARFKACLAISTLCRRLGNSGLKNLGEFRIPMCDYCAQAMGSLQFETINKTLLLEASISIILLLDNFDEQTSSIEKLLTPILDFLCSSTVQAVLQSPESFYKFIDSGAWVDIHRLCEVFQLLEAGEHQVVRPGAKTNAPIQIPGLLSRAVAPRGVEISSTLVATLHGLYNPTKFPLDGTMAHRQNALFPTSRELTTLLNLESNSGYWMRENAHDLKVSTADESQGSVAEQRSNQILKQYGIQPPDPKHSLKREALKTLRRSGYEIMRAAILSGVSASPTHAQALISAVTTDCHYIEPIHLVDLTAKVLRPLLSFSVISADLGFVNAVEQSNLPTLLRIIREHVESAKLGEIVDSEAPLLDVARDHGRKTLARCAADMLASMFPRDERSKKDNTEPPTFLPPAFGCDSLGKELIALWKAVCSLGRGHLDSGGARVGLTLVSTAVEMVPTNSFAVFCPLLEASLNTAVQNVGLNQDSPLNNAVGAVVAIIRKWPRESEASLNSALGKEGGQVSRWISSCIHQIAGIKSVKLKKHRSSVRELAEQIANHIGVAAAPKRKVKSLPEKLRTSNPARRKNRGNDDDDITLPDHALDSLYGDGDPL